MALQKSDMGNSTTDDGEISRLLFSERTGVVSLTGAGGKTSLMFHLARLLSCSGKRVLTTTTTKIFPPAPSQSQEVLICDDPADILRLVSKGSSTSRHVTAAALSLDNGKLQGFNPDAIGIFRQSGQFDWILVEADGAARRPLKAPAGHEPVIGEETSVLVSVTGLDVVGRPLTEELVFRHEIAGPLMELQYGETVTEEALVRLIVHPSGAFKGAPSHARRIVFLNKADTPEKRAAGKRVAELLNRSGRNVADAVIVGQALNDLAIHNVFRLHATRDE